MTSSHTLLFSVSNPVFSQQDADNIDCIGGINGVDYFEAAFQETDRTNHLTVTIYMKYNVQPCELIDLKDDACIYLKSSESVKADSLTLVAEKPVTDSQKLARIAKIIAMASDWCQDQENGITEGSICISAMKDIRRLLGGQPAEPVNEISVDLNNFDIYGNNKDKNSKKSISLTPARITDVFDHATQLTLVMRHQLQYISDQNIINVMMELNESLVVADVIPENWHGEDESCHQCGEPFTINENGIANHVDDNEGIDHDADSNHTPYSVTNKT